VKFDRQITKFTHNWQKFLGNARVLAFLLALVWVLTIGGIVFFWHLGSVGLIDETEPLFAEAARQMTVSGDWITPYFNGDQRFDKPPLIYWLTAIAYQTIGVNEWAARLPSALAAIALMGLVFYTLQRFSTSEFPDRSATPWLPAYLGSAAIALNPLMIIWSRTGVSDMLLTTCVSAALLIFFFGYAEADQFGKLLTHLPQPSTQTSKFKPQNLTLPSRWYLVSYVLMGLAVLAKGPIGVVLPVLIIAPFLLYVGQWRQVWREMRPLLGAVIILAIALPWYVLVTLANGQAFLESFFGYHNFERFTEVVNRHAAPWYFYFIVVLLGFAPWSVYLPVAIARLQFWKRSVWRYQPRSQQLGLFAFFWFVSIFSFFTIAVTKLPSYVVPLMPAAAILVALFWSQSIPQSAQSLPWSIKLSGLLNGGLFGAIAAVILYAPHWLETDPDEPKLASMLQASGLMTWGLAIAVLTVLVGGWLWWRRQSGWLWLVNLVAILTLFVAVLMPAMFLVDSQRQLPLRQLAQTAQQIMQPQERLVMVGHGKPSVVFYSQQQVRFMRDGEKVGSYLRRRAKKQDAPSVLVLGDRGDVDDIGLQPGQYQPIEQIGDYTLLRIPAAVFTQVRPPEEKN
jgi:4-amino-4-deoxy-L-arabinose transferase-like glycosyltransferase